ncbi:hypothetical protein DMC30DRAFT_196815 [Rhodotorula diobovata]|uniref:Uncharacterized protein n=1 Tax=Rhodotorula diobovata TaxID=5288 RepID=A0A5C5FZ88_9BASI|nr:hypothetical protein DMC30DRAFT_196815 [Rhodotorula diobovata]
MPPFPSFGSTAPAAVIRIPTFQSPTHQRSPTRAPLNREEQRAARLGRRGGSGEAQQWTSLGQLAQAGPASLAHLLAPRKGAAVACATRSEETDRRTKSARRSTRGPPAREAAHDAPAGAAGPVASTSAAAPAPAPTAAVSGADAPPPRPRGPRIPRAALRRPVAPPSPARPVHAPAPAPAPAPAVVCTAADRSPQPPRRLSGTLAAPSRAGKAFRRESAAAGSGAPVPAPASAPAAAVLSAPAKRRRVEQVDVEEDEADGAGAASEPDWGAQKGKVAAVDAPAPAAKRRPRAAGAAKVTGSAAAPDAQPVLETRPAKARPAAPRPKKRAVLEPLLPPGEVVAAASSPQAKKRRRAPVAGTKDATEAEREESSPVAKARKRTVSGGSSRAKKPETSTAPTKDETKPAKRARAKPAALASTMLSPAPPSSPPHVRSSPAPDPDATSSPRPPPRAAGRKKKESAPVAAKEQLHIETLRSKGNAGAVNALDVVIDASKRAFDSLLDDTTGARARRALKLVRARVHSPLVECSALISTHAETSKALKAAKARTKELRAELEEVRAEREEVRAELAARESD